MPAQQPTLKKLAVASGATDYNILQNNGTIAHQQVHHVSLTTMSRFQMNAKLTLSETGSLPHGRILYAGRSKAF